ncbi:MAG: hypothetical protein LBM17_02575, partial [Candidatus Accumulibacter sp.]|nr:hypothetical protein [Accumulibacter sp.]
MRPSLRWYFLTSSSKPRRSSASIEAFSSLHLSMNDVFQKRSTIIFLAERSHGTAYNGSDNFQNRSHQGSDVRDQMKTDRVIKDSSPAAKPPVTDLSPDLCLLSPVLSSHFIHPCLYQSMD